MATAYAEGEPITIALRSPRAGGWRAADIISEAIRSVDQGPRHAEELKWFLMHPDTPESVLLDYCERGEYLTELGHRKGPLSLLQRLAELGQREAILSLGLAYYEDPA